MPDSEIFHQITNRDVWNSLEELKGLVIATRSEVQTFGVKQNDHEQQIRSLELKFYGVVAGLITAIAGAAAAFFA